MEQWQSVCRKDDLVKNTGVCALVAGQQVAIFYSERNDALYAVGNYDPIGGANVISRGMIGSLGEEVVVASPLYKQHFNLTTGQCLEDPEMALSTYPVRCIDGDVQLSMNDV
ncbi:nitrite reductase (NAD(P)H) small subunit [Photobacterium sanctipauli]|uniref:Nitrite reductase (NAD(P)H) small subunit n=1 Tax=Photobacterium sanctipauli TaxID=1342794 RepID=A0A2T3NPY1_9GAMM|nr:nitrite reductase small subunit NirD [Photobacterium sanctipauli]PSW18320.1 nitrite reductase (NAD(P)H) small subunit [Photobacterium sanctipauli]